MPDGGIDKLQVLHTNLLKEGYGIPKDFNAFKVDMQDNKKLTALHTSLKEEGYDLPDFNTFQSDMNLGQPKSKVAPTREKPVTTIEEVGTLFKTPQAKVDVEAENKSAAINNTFNAWVKMNNVKPDSFKAKTKRKELEDGLNNGDYGIVFDANGGANLGRKIGGIESFIKSLKESTDSYNEAQSLKKMTDDEAIKYLNKKMQKPAEYMPGVPSGVGGYLGETFGGFSRLIAKQGAGTLAAESIAGLLAPETGGASLAVLGFLGGTAGAADEIENLNYSNELQKYYKEGKDLGWSDKDAMDRARTQAGRAEMIGGLEAVGYGLAGKAVGTLFPKNIAGEGVKKAIGKAILTAAPEILGTTAIASGSAAAKDLSAQQLGYNVDNKKIFDDVWNAASDNVKFMGTMLAVHGVQHGALKLTGYAKSQLKNFATSLEGDAAESVLKNLANQGVLKGEDVNVTIESLKRFRKAKKIVDPLNISDETVKGSIIGKYERKMKLEQEINELEKNGVPVGIDERKDEIKKIDEDIKRIYETGETDPHEVDADFPTTETAPVEEKKPAEEQKPTAETPTDWEDVKFKSNSGNDMYGKRITIPGHEDMHIVIVDGEKGKEVWEETTGSLIGNVDPNTPISEIPQRVSDKFDQMGLTADKIYEAVYNDENIGKYTGRKFPNINETEGYKKYKEKKQAEIDAVPFVYEGEERTKLEELKKEAEANGESNVASLLDVELNRRQTKGFTKYSMEDIQQKIDFARDKGKKSEILQKSIEEGTPLPDDMKGTMDGSPESLPKNLGYKTPQIQKVKESVRKILEDAHAKAAAIYNKYGFWPKDYNDNVKFSPEIALGRLIRSINAKDPAKRAARIAEAEAEAYEIAKQIDDFAKKEGIDTKTSAIDDHETQAHKEALLETVKGTEYENQARDAGLREETPTGAAGEVPTESGKEAKATDEGDYTHTDAGFASDADARAAYESSTVKDEGGTYEEFLHIKSCGDL